MKILNIRNAVRAAAIATVASTGMASAQEMKLADWLPPQHPYQEQV